MAKLIEFKLKGFKELAENLLRLGPKIEKKGLGASAYAAAIVINKEIKRTNAFTDRTGNLRANIVTARRRSPPHVATFRNKVRVARYRRTKANKVKGVAGKIIESQPSLYGKFLEYGTSRMRAHAFMRPALVNSAERAIAAMAKRLAEAVDEHGAKK